MAEFVTLRGGLVVRVDVLAFAVQLEMTGYPLRIVDGRLVVTNGHTLSSVQQGQIRAWKPALLAIVGYRVPEGV